MISSDSKIAGRQSRLEFLDEQAFKGEKQLRVDVYGYNAALHPRDFAQPPDEEGKTIFQIQMERDFHSRCVALEKKEEEINRIRKELSLLSTDPGEKILDHHAPLLIADFLIHQHFSYEGNRTLQYCSESFWQWKGIQYIELEENEIRQLIYTFLRDAKKLGDEGLLENFNPNKYKVDQIIDALRAVCYHRHHPTSGAIWLDGRETPNPEYLISFRNGLLPILDWLKDPSTPLILHTPLLLNINSLTFDFNPSSNEPKAWLQFLNTIWPEDLDSQQDLQDPTS